MAKKSASESLLFEGRSAILLELGGNDAPHTETNMCKLAKDTKVGTFTLDVDTTFTDRSYETASAYHTTLVPAGVYDVVIGHLGYNVTVKLPGVITSSFYENRFQGHISNSIDVHKGVETVHHISPYSWQFAAAAELGTDYLGGTFAMADGFCATPDVITKPEEITKTRLANQTWSLVLLEDTDEEVAIALDCDGYEKTERVFFPASSIELAKEFARAYVAAGIVNVRLRRGTRTVNVAH